MRKADLLDRFLVRATVTDVEKITPRMRRIRLVGESLPGLEWTPGQHVRVRVGALTLRTYSIWDRDADWIDLCVLVDHPDPGPGADWARAAGAGEQVSFTRPEGRLVVRPDAPYHLFLGDETAAVPFGAMMRGVSSPLYGVVEAESPADHLPLALDNWIHREESNLLQALREMALPETPGVAYIAGEARTCQTLRRHLMTERGWPRSAVTVKPFWAPGRRGMD
ncbi:siderophore-interacting protein [Actinoplanes sp. NPDC051851]|uniref:siderophore-interacting protein n=1 Tax=Actinoplanes sp. NPDC051851 TaxID=3154753 RepID=UPI00341BD22A